MEAFKFLTSSGTGSYSGFSWPMPDGGSPGEWVDVEGGLVACKNGIHACRREDVCRWLNARMFALEYDGETFVHDDEKLVGRRARLTREFTTWNEVTARLFSADCAERVAHLWEPLPGNDWSPAATVAVIRKYAAGAATREELDAARSAAWDAAWAAARSAAGDAAWAAARDTAGDTAGDAAWSAAGDAAGDAAVDTAGAATRAATRAAAWAAAGDAAVDTERDAAWDAAWDAAGAATRAAERDWQVARFWEYVDGHVDVEAALDAARESK